MKLLASFSGGKDAMLSVDRALADGHEILGLITTIKDESNRIKEDGTTDTYKMNPEWSWRNRLTLSYNIPNSKVTPSLSAESFYQLNNPDGNSFDNMRYQLSFDYKINKRNHVELFGVINSELESEDATGKYILGAAYKYSFK